MRKIARRIVFTFHFVPLALQWVMWWLLMAAASLLLVAATALLGGE